MIDRFNFYDVYGYLLPGTALLLVLGAPFVLAAGLEVDVEVSAAILGSVVAYFAGHLLQAISRLALPSKKKDSKGVWRLPSDVLLDDDDEEFDKDFKGKLKQRIQGRLKLSTGTDSERKAAFAGCRQLLQSDGVVTYAEQFQGLYALMRGLTMAAILGIAFAGGWLAGALTQEYVRVWSALAVATVTIVGGLIIRAPDSRQAFWEICAVAIFVGGGIGAFRSSDPDAVIKLLGLIALEAVAARYFYESNRAYIETFAKTVYVSFYLHAQPEAASARIPRRK